MPTPSSAVELPALTEWTFGPEQAAAIRMPVLSVIGANTQPLWVEIAEFLRSALPHVEEARIKKVGHLLHIQRPEPVAHAMAKFLTRNPIADDDDPATPTRRPGTTTDRAARLRAQASQSTINHQERTMPIINVKLIEDVFTPDQKREIIERLTDAMVTIEGENMRPVTWVVVEEVASGDMGVGGKPLSTEDVKALAAGVPA